MPFGGAVKLTGESEYKKALNNITQSLKEVASEMKLVTSQFDKNDKSAEAISKKTEALTKKLEEQSKKVDILKEAYSKMKTEYDKQVEAHKKLADEYEKEKGKLEKIASELGTTSAEYQAQKAAVDKLADAVRASANNMDANEQSMSRMRVQINNAQTDCNNTARAIEELGDEAVEAGEDAETSGDGFTIFKGIVADLAATAIKKAVEGLKELGEQLINVGKQAISSYGEYEQLTGGVETMFGDSADTIKQYAQEAYKTAGLSANEYMDTVIKFSASLVKATGKGVQQDLDELEEALKESYNEQKRANEDAYEELKQTWEDRIKLAKEGNSELSGEAKKQRDDEISALKKANQEAYDAAKQAWEDRLKASKGASNYDSLKRQRDEELKALKESNAEAVNALKESWEERLKVTKSGGADNLDELKKQRDDELKALKRANEDMLAEMKKANEEQLKAAEESNNASVTTAESLERAAELANTAIIDMSDNVNKISGDMQGVMNAYMGFAKENYQMLDNLRLGYSGTKSGMEKLISDANKLKEEMGEAGDLIPGDMASIIEAIHLVQTEMGITGTTAEEADKTIQGSAGSMRAAWQNLLTGIADGDQDVGPLIDNYVESLKTATKNYIPRIREVLKGFGETVKHIWEEVLPELGLEFPEIKPLVDGLQWIVNNGPTIISVLAGIAAGFTAFKAVAVVTTAIAKFKTFFATIKTGTTIFKALGAAFNANPIGIVITAVSALVTAFITLWNTSEGFRNFFINLWEKIKTVAEDAWLDISGFFEGAWLKIKEVWQGITQFFEGLWIGIKNVFSQIATWVDANIFQPIKRFFEPIIAFFKEAFEFIIRFAESCWLTIKLVWQVVSTWFDENVIQPVVRFFTGLWEGIENAASEAWNFIVGVWQVVSTWFDENIIQPIAGFFTKMWDGLKDGASKAWEGVKQVFGSVATWFKNIFGKAWRGVKDVFSKGGKIFDGIKEGIVNAFKTVVNAIIRGINKVVAIPFNAINDVLDTLKDVSILGIEPFGWLGNISVPQIPELARGGVLERGARLVTAGEAGAEAIVPLENNTKWIHRVAGEMSRAVVIGQNAQRPGQGSNDTQYKSMVSAFKDALGQMKIELDDEVAGKFVERTVTRIVYAS